MLYTMKLKKDIVQYGNMKNLFHFVQLFYCKQRGIKEEDAVSIIVSGFCKDVFKELPMEFAVEAQKLMEVTLEGSIG
jgi:succinate dehydrogenase flavin-adding protein (antitoxin of CptAB toxin-antitoxin module)